MFHAKFQKEAEEIAKVRATKPPLRMVMATGERAGPLPVSKVFFRGNPESPRETVLPAELMVLRRSRAGIEIPENEEGRRSTGGTGFRLSANPVAPI